jgi:hypothetical protein
LMMLRKGQLTRLPNSYGVNASCNPKAEFLNPSRELDSILSLLKPSFRRLVLLVAAIFLLAPVLEAYSVLTHEQVVDFLWDDQLRPLLLKRFPGLTEDELRQAHAYAYGGAVIQDLGYYPFGSKEFSDLVHYVRSGDFVEELIRESQDANEYAFALGALAHYASDTEGHPAVNRSVALEFPKLRKKFGPSVTYEDDPLAHLRTEFGFDVTQVAKQRYVGDQYHAFIGFEVSQPLLERAFPVIYGVPFKDVIPHESLAIGTYRWSVSSLVPKMTKVAKLVKGDEEVPEKNDQARKLYLYHISRADYEKEWGKDYQRPGFGTRVLAFFLRLVPKIGPFKALAFHPPTTQTQDLYFKSINATVDRYRHELLQVRANKLELANLDFDTGQPSRPGEYKLTDKTYAKWLERLSKNNFANITPMVRVNILEFYGNPNAEVSTRKHKDDWKKTQAALEQLKAWRPDITPASAAPVQAQ